MTDLQRLDEALAKLRPHVMDADGRPMYVEEIETARWAMREWRRVLAEGREMWLCREGDHAHDWLEGTPPHCWYNGSSGHNPECGSVLIVDRSE